MRQEATGAAEAAGQRASDGAGRAPRRAQAQGAERRRQPAAVGGAAGQRRRGDPAGSLSQRGLVAALSRRVQGLRDRVRGREARHPRGDEDRRLRGRRPGARGARAPRAGGGDRHGQGVALRRRRHHGARARARRGAGAGAGQADRRRGGARAGREGARRGAAQRRQVGGARERRRRRTGAPAPRRRRRSEGAALRRARGELGGGRQPARARPVALDLRRLGRRARRRRRCGATTRNAIWGVGALAAALALFLGFRRATARADRHRSAPHGGRYRRRCARRAAAVDAGARPGHRPRLIGHGDHGRNRQLGDRAAHRPGRRAAGLLRSGSAR